MAQGIGVEEIIDIQTEVQSGGTIRAEFGTGLILTTNSNIPAGGPRKAQRFGSLSALTEVFADGNNTVSIIEDAKVWFAADPAPKALYVGRWASSNVNTSVRGGRVTQTLDQIKAITDGSYRVNNVNTSTLNFSTATSLGKNATDTGVADLLEASIRSVTGMSNATVTWVPNGAYFLIDYGVLTDLGAFTTSTANAIGTDLTDNLKLAITTSADSAEYNEGVAAESVDTALTACIGLAVSGAPSALMMGTDTPETVNSVNSRTALETYAQAGDFMTARLETSTGALTPNENTSALAATFSNSRSHVIPVYSRGTTVGTESQAPRPDIGIMAKLSSQNFDLPQSIITLVPKPLEGVGTTDITETQLAELERKQASVLTNVGGLPSLLGGWTGKSGVWADAQWWLLWLKNEMERSIFEAMRSSKRLSVAQLRDTINGVMSKAVNSGGAKPGGVVSDVIKHDIRAITGNYEFNGIMPNGYVLWIDPPQSQTSADRAARIARFKVWVAPSEAIHSVAGGIILSG